MKDWFENLQPRERMIVIVGSILLVLTLLYSALWAPVMSKNKKLEAAVENKQSSLRWMQEASQKILSIQAANSSRLESGRSLISVVDTGLVQAGLKSSLDRMEPEGNESVKLWLVKAAFDDLIRTLGKLEETSGVRVKSISINPGDTIGLVDARVVLTLTTQ